MLKDKIRKHRKIKGYTFRQLAQKTNVSISYLCQLEKHEEHNPSVYKLGKIAKALDVTLEYLINDVDNLTEQEEQALLFEKFNHLNEKNKTTVLNLIDVLRKQNEQ